jgi:hypothetical protein
LSIATAGGCSTNAVEFAILYPGEDSPHWAFCAPRLDDDPKVEAVWGGAPRAPASRSRLARCKAGSTLREARLVRGWARDAANSDMPVPVEVVIDGVVLGSTLANRSRADLATAGYGHGRHGFDFRFPAPLASDRPHSRGHPAALHR